MNLIICADLTGGNDADVHDIDHQDFLNKRGAGYWRKAAVVSWMVRLKPIHGIMKFTNYQSRVICVCLYLSLIG